MTFEMCLRKIFKKEKEKSNIRTFKNTPKHTYNCGGYALKTYDWLTFREDPEHCDTKYKKDKMLKLLTEELLNKFETLRLIKKLSEVQKNEYPIAFRISENDFHFMCRDRNYQWYNKMGDSETIDNVTQEYVFSKEWNSSCECYDSQIVLFAKKWD